MTRYDKLLVIVVLIVAVTGLFISRSVQDARENIYAVIVVDGEEYKKINLKDAVPGEFTVRTQWGNNTIEIGKNKIRMKASSCPDKLCVKQGWLSRPNQMSVCLPNRVYIKINAQEDVIDDVAF